MKYYLYYRIGLVCRINFCLRRKYNPCKKRSQSAPGEVAAEEPDELGESTTGFEDTASCTGVDFGTDSDFEVSTSSGSTRGRPKKNKWRQKAAGGALKGVEKKTNVSKEKEIDLERERILDEVLPMQFRTCFLCGL